MSAGRMWKAVLVVLACGAIGLAHAKLPAPTEEQKARAAETRAKAEAAGRKEAELLGKYQERAADNYRRKKVATDLKR
jgi:hypothetical protein